MIIGIILILIAAAEMFLGLRFIFGYEKKQSTVWYGLFCMAVGTYVLANGVGFATNSFYIGERIGWVGGILTAVFFLPFSFSFPLAEKKTTELLPLVLWPIAIFIPALLFTDILVKDQAVYRYSEGYRTATGDFFWVILLVFTVYWIWGFSNVIRRLRRSDGIHHWQLKVVLFGVLTSLVVSVIFDILLPLVTVNYYGYIGSIFSAIWLGFTSYSLVKK